MIKKYENLKVDIKMYKSEICKSKVSGLKAQKKIILWTLIHVSAISENPVQYKLSRTSVAPRRHLVLVWILEELRHNYTPLVFEV